MTVEISTAIIISVISLLFSIYMGIKGNKRTDTKDVEERTKEHTELTVKLDYISKSTNDIKEEISALVKKVDAHGDRLTKAEESLKSVWKRIDSIEQRLSKEDEE